MIRPLRLLCAISTSLLCSVSYGQTLIPSNTIVTQNFNSIGTGATVALPDNWKMSSAGNAAAGWTDGSNVTTTTHTATSGIPSTGGRYNWATAGNTDRAIGFLTDAGYSAPNTITAYYRNNTGAAVNSLTIAFTVERYVVNTAFVSVAFSLSTDGVSFTSQPAGDISTTVFASGANAGTFANPQTVYKTLTINGLNIPLNGDVYLRWTFINADNINAQGLGLDDVSVFAGAATPTLAAQLRDILQVDNGVKNQFSEGDVIRYVTVIKNIGTGDANNVEINIPAPSNTTLVSGSIKTSALAKDDDFFTPFNTALTSGNVLFNDFGLPSPTVVSFGTTKNSGATTAGSMGVTDNGGSVMINTDGTFSYTPPAGFIGNDKFSYLASTGSLPDNDAVVTVAVGAAPTAAPDTYNVIGNVSISPNAAAGILSNDGGSILRITAVNGSAANLGAAITTTKGGNLMVNTDGSFTYNPPAGFEGNDNFTYTIDNGFAAQSTATVTLAVNGMVWFINNNAGAGGDGRLSAPFNSIGAFQVLNNGMGNNPAAHDNIFIYENATDYTGSITLLNGQKLIGQDATASLAVLTGYAVPAYSALLPTMNSGNGIIVNLTTTVTATNAINLSTGSSNIIRGVTVGNTTGSGINGNGFGTLTASDISITGSGQALNLTNGALNVAFNNLSSGSGTNGVWLTNISGTLTANGGAISGNSGTAFYVSGGNAIVTYAGAISQNTGGQRLINVQNRIGGAITLSGNLSSTGTSTGINIVSNTGGTIDLSGTNKTINTGINPAVTLNNNTGATINFSNGGLAITTTSGNGFTGTGGGTVNVTGPNNVVTSVTGIGVNIQNTTIGANGITFKSVSVNGGANGIILTGTGSNSFTVTGDGVNRFSGGTIQNSTGADGATAGNGIYLNNASNVFLNFMQLNDHQNNGIYGASVTNLFVNQLRFTGNLGSSNSGAFEESVIQLVNSGGNITVQNSRLDGGSYNGFLIRNTSGSSPSLNLNMSFDTVSIMQGSLADVRNTALQAIIGDGTANVNMHHNLLTYWWGNAIQVSIQNNATGTATINNNVASQTSGALAAAGGIWVNGGALTYTISNNTVNGTNGAAISADKGSYNKFMNGTISGNIIGTSGVTNSGSATGIAIFASHHGPGTTTTTINNNTIRQINGSANGAITVLMGDDVGFGDVGGGFFNVTITSNNIQESGTIVNSAQHGILVTSGVTSSGSLGGDNGVGCFNISDNSITNFNMGSASTAQNRIRINQRFHTTARFPGYGGTNNDNVALGVYLLGRNTASNYSVVNNVSAGGQGFIGGAACAQ